MPMLDGVIVPKVVEPSVSVMIPAENSAVEVPVVAPDDELELVAPPELLPEDTEPLELLAAAVEGAAR